MRQEAGAKTGLFASVLDGHPHQAERRARLLRVVPFVLALHLLALVLLSRERTEPVRLPARAGDEAAPVLTLLAARPAIASAVPAPAAAPAPAVPRSRVARKALPQPKPPPTPAPEPTPPSPPAEQVPAVADAAWSSHDTSEATGGAVPPDVALDGVAEAAVAGVMGGLLRGVLASGVPPPPPPLSPEEREEWVVRYMETLIRSRFMHVRYPHLASAAGITGEVLLRVSISAQGRLLKLELLGRCPHPVLCDAAQETVRNAEPFPPPPPELGTPFLLELPFRYHLN
ncbi:TonB family protein [Hyalangium gracile]|uniref:TonB family protein n=1 Tax=Hyalangium gracile TaxID=394092 RepID=UPI001CCB7614|nr:TonB family protein [Hyalangium gracile]